MVKDGHLPSSVSGPYSDAEPTDPPTGPTRYPRYPHDDYDDDDDGDYDYDGSDVGQWPEPDGDVVPDQASVQMRRELRRRVHADHVDPPTGRLPLNAGGRHARRDSAQTNPTLNYVPRHAISTPGPSAVSCTELTEQFARVREDPTEPPSRTRPKTNGAGPNGAGPNGAGPNGAGPNGAGVNGVAGTNGNGLPAAGGRAEPVELSPVQAALNASAAKAAGIVLPTAPEPVSGGKRERVVLSQRQGFNPRPVRTVVDVQELTQVGEVLSSSLIRSQLALALRIGGIALIVLGSLPAIFMIFPVLGRFELFGLRLPWLLLGGLAYPFMLALGWMHTRSAERLEEVFADHIQS